MTCGAVFFVSWKWFVKTARRIDSVLLIKTNKLTHTHTHSHEYKRKCPPQPKNCISYFSVYRICKQNAARTINLARHTHTYAVDITFLPAMKYTNTAAAANRAKKNET